MRVCSTVFSARWPASTRLLRAGLTRSLMVHALLKGFDPKGGLPGRCSLYTRSDELMAALIRNEKCDLGTKRLFTGSSDAPEQGVDGLHVEELGVERMPQPVDVALMLFVCRIRKSFEHLGVPG